VTKPSDSGTRITGTECAARLLSGDPGFQVLALVTRAAALGPCEPIPPKSAALADKEGWIALPKPGSLQMLAWNRL
jgi:hypothetical protein